MVVQGLGALLKLVQLLEDLEQQQGQNRGQSQGLEDLLISQVREPVRKAKKAKKRVSAYHRKYGQAFKKIAPRFKKKNGSWMKDGFKRTSAAARKVAKK